MITITGYEHLLVTTDPRGEVVRITLNQPRNRNALSRPLVAELGRAIGTIEDDANVRVVVLRGAGGVFCAGGDIGNFDQIRATVPLPGMTDPIATMNRSAGALFTRLRRLHAVVVAAIEGAAMGGGFGLACTNDVAIATADAKFAMSETTLGVVPAQISPFVADRIGRSQSMRLALTGERIDGTEAQRLGVVHRVVTDSAALDAAVEQTIGQVLRCGPAANRITKEIFLNHGDLPLERHLDWAAGRFAATLRGDEGAEGVRAFLEKRPAAWVRK